MYITIYSVLTYCTLLSTLWLCVTSSLDISQCLILCVLLFVSSFGCLGFTMLDVQILTQKAVNETKNEGLRHSVEYAHLV